LISNLLSFVLRRAVNAFITLLLLILLIFALVHILAPSPLDLARIYAGSPHVPAGELAVIIKQYSLDAPIPVQFYNYVVGLLQGNLGIDTIYKVPEIALVETFLPITLELVITGLVVALVIGLYTGAIAATNRRGPADHAIRGVYLVTWSAPPFLAAFVIQLFLAYELNLLPATGLVDPGLARPAVVTGFPIIDALLSADTNYLVSLVHHLVLPALVIAVTSFGIVTRIMRSSMVEALDKDYVRLAYMKGLSGRQVAYGTAFRNAVVPVITLAALFFGTSTAGAVIIEDIFEYHGMGWFAVQAISGLDYVGILGVTVVVGLSVILANFVADILYGMADPRVRL
jgi:peptide/nickel transport system permease protein